MYGWFIRSLKYLLMIELSIKKQLLAFTLVGDQLLIYIKSFIINFSEDVKISEYRNTQRMINLEKNKYLSMTKIILLKFVKECYFLKNLYFINVFLIMIESFTDSNRNGNPRIKIPSIRRQYLLDGENQEHRQLWQSPSFCREYPVH